jgi:hypothetical protein
MPRSEKDKYWARVQKNIGQKDEEYWTGEQLNIEEEEAEYCIENKEH